MQAAEDVRYVTGAVERTFADDDVARLKSGVLRAYRWQYILSGAQHPQFLKVLGQLITPAQADRIKAALGPLM